MKLLSASDRKALPPLYSQEGKGLTATAHVHYFHPLSPATWYASEFDGEDLFFGLCDLGFGMPELGYFSLSELESVKLRGLGVERDLYWTPKPLSECRVSRLVPGAQS